MNLGGVYNGICLKIYEIKLHQTRTRFTTACFLPVSEPLAFIQGLFQTFFVSSKLQKCSVLN